MEESYLREIAAQLRKPTGDFGNEVALKMNESNMAMNLNTIDALNINSGETILEVGMANGMFVKDILSKAENVNYIGCDYSEDMIDNANRVNKDVLAQGIAYFHKASAHLLPVKSNIADKLLTINTMYFWENPELVLIEFLRVLKPDGLLAISIRPESCLIRYPSTQFNFNYFNKEDLIELLESNNFEVKSIIENTEPKVEIDGQSFSPEHLIVLSQPA